MLKAHILICLKQTPIVSLPLDLSGQANAEQLRTAQPRSMLSCGGAPHPANLPLLQTDGKGTALGSKSPCHSPATDHGGSRASPTKSWGFAPEFVQGLCH